MMRVTVAVRLSVSVCRADGEISGLAEMQEDVETVPLWSSGDADSIDELDAEGDCVEL